MRVLLLGAYGFIGSAIAREIVSRGHYVSGVGRDSKYGRRILPQLDWISADLNQMTDANRWRPLLEGMDAVINASGLLQKGEGGSVEAVQLHAVRALVDACLAVQVERLVQISAAGAVSGASSDFMSTKGEADALIEAADFASLILRPGLVIGRNAYGGTELIRAAAAVPFQLKFEFHQSIQCIALSDVVEAVANALEPRAPRTGCFDLVERQPRSLEAIIGLHRRWLGLPEPRWSVAVPNWLLRAVSWIADLFGHLGWRSPMRSNGLIALEAGVHGDPEDAVDLLQREPLSLEATLHSQPAGKQDRLYARLSLMQPVILAALAIMWAGSGTASLLQLDRAADILEVGAVDGATARIIAIGGGLIDVLLAIAVLVRRTVRAALLAMIVLTIFYLLGGTLLVPALWIDPLAPFAKALPAALLALVAYWMVERR